MRNYTNTATPIALTVATTTSSTTLTVASTTGYPNPPFTLALERGTANEEVALCTAKTATTFTVTRGYDATTGKVHSIGTSVEHAVAAIDYREANLHHEAASGVHGVAGAVVGTTDAQVLTGKTINAGSNTITGLTSAHIPDLPVTKILAGSGLLPVDVVPAQTWASITGKPATFAPTIGTTLTTAKVGNYTPAWAEVTGKPSTFTPSAHIHDDRYYTGGQVNAMLAGKANAPNTGSLAVASMMGQQIGLRYESNAVFYVDGSEFELASLIRVVAIEARLAAHGI